MGRTASHSPPRFFLVGATAFRGRWSREPPPRARKRGTAAASLGQCPRSGGGLLFLAAAGSFPEVKDGTPRTETPADPC